MTEPDFPSLEYLNHAIGYVEQASSMPLSASVLINREEMLSLLYTARERMPQEINYAREMLRERNLYISKVKREAEEILDRARDKAAHLMQKTEIMKEAERRAAKVVEDARPRPPRSAGRPTSIATASWAVSRTCCKRPWTKCRPGATSSKTIHGQAGPAGAAAGCL